jgi:UDP-GlcNAc:undecaprenyl-phosphate GlcNAc-1-phosphate transferase
MDTTVVVLKRLLRGISPFTGGRDHLSHRLMRAVLSKRQAVFSLWLLTLFFGLISIVISSAGFHFEGALTTVGLAIWFSVLLFFARTKDE